MRNKYNVFLLISTVLFAVICLYELNASAKDIFSSTISTDFKTEGTEQINDNKYLFYTEFEQLGLNYRTATPIDVCKAMPNHSIFLSEIRLECEGFGGSWTSNSLIHPNILGSIKIIKISPYRCTLYRWENAYGSTRQYVATLYSLDNYKSYTWTGWEPIGQPHEAQKRNDPKAAKELVECAESYLGKIWAYDQRISRNAPRDGNEYHHKIFNEEGYPMIDCLTLVSLAIKGIPYKNSPYVNNLRYAWREQKIYPWASNPTGTYLREFTHWCLNSGYEIYPGKNYENLQAGDLVFWGTHPDKTSSFSDFMNQPRNIDHVGIYTGRWVPDPNRNNELHPQTIEVAYYKSPIVDVVKHRFIDEVAPVGNITSHSVEHITMFARIPLNIKGYWTNKNPHDNPLNIIHTSKMKTSYTIEIIGNGNPVSLWIGGQNMIGNIGVKDYNVICKEIESAKLRVLTELMPAAKITYDQQIIPDILDSKSIKTYYFDDQLNYIGSEILKEAAYMYKSYCKKDNTAIIESELMEIRNKLAINSMNYYDKNESICSPIIIKGHLDDGSVASINTETGEILINGNGKLEFISNTKYHPAGNKYIYMPTSQETDIYWEN